MEFILKSIPQYLRTVTITIIIKAQHSKHTNISNIYFCEHSLQRAQKIPLSYTGEKEIK